MENFHNSKVLRELGFNDKNEWMLYDEKVKKFFEYIAENLDDDNILTEQEMQQYSEIHVAGAGLEEESLENELKTLESYFPGILTISEESTTELEKEIEFLKKNTEEREERIARMQEAEKIQLKEIESFEKQTQELNYQEKTLSEECLEKSKLLEELQNSNQERVVETRETYLQPQQPACFVYQMPLDQFQHKCDHFLSQLEAVVRKHFKVSNSVNDVDKDPKFISEVLELKKRVLEIEKKKFEYEEEYAGKSSITQNVDQFRNLFKGDRDEMRSIIEEIDVENENLELQNNVLHTEAQLLIEQAAEQKIVKMFSLVFEQKNQQTMPRLESIKSITDLADDVTLKCELLWAVMQVEIERLKNRADNTEEHAKKAQDSSKRMRLMKTVASKDLPTSLNEMLFEKFQELLVQNLPIDKDNLTTIDACVQEYQGMEEKAKAAVKTMVSQEHLASLYKLLRKIDAQSDKLRDFIFTGPTNRPSLYDSKYAVQIYEKGQKTKEIEKNYSDAKSNFKKAIIEPSQNDRFFRMERNLWIYFLTEPKKVLECIKEVQKKAAETGHASFKALNITLPSK